MDTLLYVKSIPMISSLQEKLGNHSDVMQTISVVFDPKYAFLIYAPIAYLLDPKVGKKVVLTTVIAEWLNMILKWILHGERPYWYVHSSGHFDPEQTPIKQFPITCELGPGHPSGHAMVTAAVWYIIIDSVLKAMQATQKKYLRRTRLSIWTIYALLLGVVSVSRVFLGCHFPHQCLVGAMLGVLVANWVSGVETRARHFIAASALLFTSAFGTYSILQALGFDPSWTIKLATEHCEKREYIHPDTAPFFSIMRYCGFALGCGLGQLLPIGKLLGKQVLLTTGDDTGKGRVNPLSSTNMSWLSVKILTALLIARLVDNLGLFVSHASLTLFYSSAFFSYTIFAYLFINL